jgi:hypothetical protein
MAENEACDIGSLEMSKMEIGSTLGPVGKQSYTLMPLLQKWPKAMSALSLLFFVWILSALLSKKKMYDPNRYRGVSSSVAKSTVGGQVILWWSFPV